MTSSKSIFIDTKALMEKAGEKVFRRGQDYYTDGSVDIEDMSKESVSGKIIGTHTYRATLSVRNGKISGSCTCPAARDFGFCKHLVALGLTANNAIANGNATDSQPELGSRTQRINDYLQSLGKETLVRWVSDQATNNPSFFSGLELAARVAKGETKDVTDALKKEITKVTQTRGGYVDYDRSSAWADRLHNTLAKISPLIYGGSPALALDLLEHAFDRLEEALNNIDDSDGQVGDVCAEGAQMYRQACAILKPDPVDLAKRLFRRETESGWSFFSSACKSYKDLLGEKGLSIYHQLAQEEWNRLPSVNPGRRGYDGLESKRWALKSILDDLAEQEGNIDAQISLRTKDLSSPSKYVDLAELCLEHGRDEDALKWAEEGLWQFKDQFFLTESLEVLAFELYLKRGETQKAQDLIWESFWQHPEAAKYREIKDNFPDLAPSALSLLEQKSLETHKNEKGNISYERIVTQKIGGLGYGRSIPVPAVIWLQILLYIENNLKEAWRVADLYGAPDELLVALCDASVKDFPDRALETYRRTAERLIEETNSASYKQSIKILEKIKLLQSDDANEKFFSTLREKYKRKSSFIPLLDKAKEKWRKTRRHG